MNVKVGNIVECINHMSNRGKVIKVYYKPVSASNNAGAFMKRTYVIFESFMDGKVYDMKAQDLRLVRE